LFIIDEQYSFSLAESMQPRERLQDPPDEVLLLIPQQLDPLGSGNNPIHHSSEEGITFRFQSYLSQLLFGDNRQ